jgi:molybdate transport system ATP-binding protein
LFITGKWKEAQDKLQLLLKNKLVFTPMNLKELNVQEFIFPYKTAFVSYQEGIEDKHATYYQQRFYATEVDEIKTLKKFLFGEKADYKVVHTHYKLLEQFNLRHLLEAEVIKLSNGETRKASILKALLTNPQILVLDNSYAGIDQNTVPELDELFNDLANSGLNLIVFGTTEFPSWISQVLAINSPEEVELLSREKYLQTSVTIHFSHNSIIDVEVPSVVPIICDNVVSLKNVSVNYGEKQVLQHINWDIKPLEKWILKGENGAGKSTLLSLIYADHPQSYANDIELFGRKRGSGESIWDIKEKMALYSPEFYYYFDKTHTCIEALLSGIYFHPFKKGIKQVGLESFAQKLFLLFFEEEKLDWSLNRLSGIHQRLVLFIRTLARNAPLVLLDEPFQGFDAELTEKCKILTEICCRDKTLIFISHKEGDVPEGVDKVFRL